MKKGKGKSTKLLPNSLRIISSCIKTVSTNASTAVRSAAASISSPGDDRKEQVLWAGFDKLELSATSVRCALLLGYLKGFQVFDVEDASGIRELVSRRDGPVTFLQMLPAPAKGDGNGKYKSSHPILVVVGGNENERMTSAQCTGQGNSRRSSTDTSFGIPIELPTAVRFYSMKSNEYVKVIDFKSAVFMVRCCPRVVAIGLEEQIYCFDTLTLEKKFIVLTYPVPRVGEQGSSGINMIYGPMALGSRWLAYPPNRPFLLNTGRVSPKSLASSVSPSTSPGSGTIMARYAVESSKNLAAGLLNLGDMGYKKLSKYYPELLPESPSGSPGWKAGKLAASEPENAGVIVVKDLVSSDVIAQFRAHTSPILALCFDPSGTLLVTASVHGNNMNIFRIMPHKGGASGSGDWSTSYVHLYKLYRGITSAVIQDICFSRCSQWIAIVSARGTCHIFALSPYGGDEGFHTLHKPGQGTSLFLASTQPWWSTSSLTVNEQPSLPPPTCTLSAITRIKCSDSGLLNSVSNTAASMVGKLWVPSGAVAAIFHNSNSTGSTGSRDVKSTSTSLEHILVYTPSGFVVQHDILSSMGPELIESRTGSLSAPQANPQNEELRVKVEPTQWWDVCRRLENTEREECISGSIFDGLHDAEIDKDSKMVSQENASSSDKKLAKSDSLKSPDRSHWYLSNAEVQINSGRLPLWQKSKMHFHVMDSPIEECGPGGEYEIEKASSHELEIRHKDLLPIIDNFPRATRSGWIDSSIPADEKHLSDSGSSDQTKEKTDGASIISHSKPPSFSSTESSEGGSSRRMENLLDLDHMAIDRPQTLGGHAEDKTGLRGGSRAIIPYPSQNTCNRILLVDNAAISRSSSLGNEMQSLHIDNPNSEADILIPSRIESTVDFGPLFKEGYYNKPELLDRCQSTEVITHEAKAGDDTPEEKLEDEEGPREEGWISGMFDFSE
ncbi:autophagy-related protein 18g-like isoform X1 [Salvia hispanica]|uniref:autophagy-related protein 18g-like isoform X1 n=1 Tax=Salvia hispanica TaxID=49212 RepID=UPI00200935ED|nr:autophagy-related protein 18g-like isoform X1 [Salvia hispanica]